MLPHVIRFNAGHVGRLYDRAAAGAGPDAPPALLEDRICELRAAGRAAGEPAGLPGAPHACLPELAAEAEKQWTAGFNPRPVTRVELLELYEAAYA